MRTRTEIELEKTEQTDRMVSDGSEERMLLGLVIEILLDIRDNTAGRPQPAPSGFGVGNVGAGRTPYEQG